MLINFQLRDVSTIAPFGDKQPVLHWFGLSDGWYWLTVGDDELFCFGQQFVEREEPWCSDHTALPYVDYYVARLWEDLFEQLPAILTPLPPELADRAADAVGWQRWQDEAQRWLDQQDSDSAFDRFSQARGWWGDRCLNTGYLRNSPLIWCWRSGDTLHVRWDNRREMQDGYPVWSAVYGEYTFSVTTFLEELHNFDARFMVAMTERVVAVRQHRLPPDVHIDLDQLT